MGLGGLAKQLQQCLRKLHSFTDGQVQLIECDWEALSHIILEISPNDGLYKGGRYKFQISFNEDYPRNAPSITCLTNIFHPNIDLSENGGEVCISIISEWTESTTIEDIIVSLLFLLYNPNTDDPLSDIMDHVDDRDSFERAQLKFARGDYKEVTEDYDFDFDADAFEQARVSYENLDQCEWDVLAHAARVEWEYKLEQQTWQEEIKTFEAEQKAEQVQANKVRFERTVAEKPQSSVNSGQRTDYAFGKTSLQRCSTLAAPCGQVLNFNAPDKNAVRSWLPISEKAVPEKAVPQENSTEEREEEEMDCTPPPPVSRDLNEQPSCLSWQPFCKSDVFTKPAMLRTFTC